MLQKLTHIILALTVFLSSAGIVVDKHFCQNELKNIAIFAKASNCHAAKKTCPRHQPTGEEEEKKNCCENETEYFKLDQDQQVQTFDFELINPKFFIAAVTVFFNLENTFAQNENHQYLTDRPPIVEIDILILTQRFLC